MSRKLSQLTAAISPWVGGASTIPRPVHFFGAGLLLDEQWAALSDSSTQNPPTGCSKRSGSVQERALPLVVCFVQDPHNKGGRTQGIVATL